ncbi:MAG: sigma-70 family RNA polymerase sigma factor [Pirellulales bacterium]
MSKTRESESEDRPVERLPPGERTQWLLQYEPWLRLLARHEVHHRLARKFDPSDVVQQTLLEAWQGWEGLEARDERRRLAWLREILAHQLARHVRHFQGAQKRDVGREVSFQDDLDRSAARLETLIPGRDPSPSAAAAASERTHLLAQVLEELPEDYREVILLRNLEELPHAEVAQRMGRTEAAVRMLWLRALAALNAALLKRGIEG